MRRASQSLVPSYLAELKRKLTGSRAAKRRILGEIEGHLAELVDEEERAGLRPPDAEQRAIETLGPAVTLAEQFASDGLLDRRLTRSTYMRAGLVTTLAVAAIAVTVISTVRDPRAVEGVALGQSSFLFDHREHQANTSRPVAVHAPAGHSRSSTLPAVTQAHAHPNLVSAVVTTKHIAIRTRDSSEQPARSPISEPGRAVAQRKGRVPSTDVSIRLSGPSFVPVEEPSTYQFFVTNKGPSRATGVDALVRLPPNVSMVGSTNGRCQAAEDWVSCRLGSISVGGYKLTKITLRTSTSSIGTLRTFVVSHQAERDPSNNSADKSVVFQTLPAVTDVAVSITKSTAPPESWWPAGTTQYLVTLTNRGPGDAMGVAVHYDIPPGLNVGWGYPTLPPPADNPHATPKGTTTCGWGPRGPDEDPEGVNSTRGTYDFCIPRLVPGESKTFEVELFGMPGGSPNAWTANAYPVTPDIVPSNNTATSPVDTPNGPGPGPVTIGPGQNSADGAPPSVTRQVPLCSAATDGEPCTGGAAPMAPSPGVISPSPVVISSIPVKRPVGGRRGAGIHWRPLVSGPSPRETRNRIYYLRTKRQAERWLPYLNLPSDRRALRSVRFRRFGVLLIIHRPVAATVSLDAVSWVDHGLMAQLTLTPWSPPTCTTPPCTPPPGSPPSARYILATIRKASLPGHVRLLHIREVSTAHALR